MRRQSWLTGAPLLALALAVNVSAAPAMQQDDGWLAWVGCWRPDGDTTDVRLCILSSGEGVRMLTLAEGKVQSESRLIADGQLHNVDQEGCKGTERALWSADRQRVFVRSDLTCGTSITRKVTGIFSLVSAREWMSVQSVASAGTTGTRMVRYVAAEPANLPRDIADALQSNRLARETARYAAASLVDLNDVREALENVDARVVEDWLTALEQPFDLNGRKLMELADAGVPSSIIDVLVAVSNPDHFAVHDRVADDDVYERRRVGGVSCWDAAYAGSWYDPFGYRYGGYGYGCYPPRGYSGWGYGGYYGWRYTPVVVVDRGKSERGGKATKGGYSSGRSDDGSAKSKQTGSTSTAPAKTSTSGSTGNSDSGSSDSSGKAKKKGT